MQRGLKHAAAFMLIAAVAVISFYIGTAVVSTSAGAPVQWLTAAANPVQQPPITATETERLLASIYSRVSPSVVSISVLTEGGAAAFGRESNGTGFVIDTAGHIVTNNHVVDDATRIEVNFFDGRIVRGTIVGLDPDSDLAVIRVDVPPETLTPVPLGDSDSLFIGQSVVAIGSPFNQRWTMTTGIISALDRTIQGLTNFSIGSVVQTDAAINPGNSGGPLLNLNGEVIGVNSQIISEARVNSGVGFAIPSNLVRRVASALIERGEMDYSYLGIQGGDVYLGLIEALDLPNNARGVVVTNVEPRGPAARAGLRSASNLRQFDGVSAPTSVDIITAINGEPLTGMSDLISYLASNTEPGDTVVLTVVRNGREQLELTVVLEARP